MQSSEGLFLMGLLHYSLQLGIASQFSFKTTYFHFSLNLWFNHVMLMHLSLSWKSLAMQKVLDLKTYVHIIILCAQWKLKKLQWIDSGTWLLMKMNIKLWFGILKCTTLWCNISSFAIEGVNLIDASILNSRLTYCAVQPFDSFQIILLLILTKPFIIICIPATALSWIVKLMFSNPIWDAFYMLICHTPYISTCLQKKALRRCHSFSLHGYL